MSESQHLLAVGRDTVASSRWMEVCEGWTLLAQGDLHVMLERMPASTREVRHWHAATRQFYFVLRGQASVVVGDDVVFLEAEHGIEIPAGVVHQMRARGERPLEFLVISTQPPRGDRVDLAD